MDNQKRIEPEPLFCCCNCREDYSFPKEDLRWFNSQLWCSNCFDATDENGERISFVKLEPFAPKADIELANAQAEIEALKKERTMSGIRGQCMMEESDKEIILLRRELDEARIKNRKLSNIVSVLNCGMQTMVFTPNELAGHECLAKHKLLSLFDYWRKKVAPTMRALVNGNEDSQVKKLEIELADKDKQLNNLREEIEGAIKMCGEYAIRASEGLCASLALSIGRLKHQIECELEHKKKLADCANTGMIANEKLFDQLTDARAEIERKDKLIEQMREAVQLADTLISELIDTHVEKCASVYDDDRNRIKSALAAGRGG